MGCVQTLHSHSRFNVIARDYSDVTFAREDTFLFFRINANKSLTMRIC